MKKSVVYAICPYLFIVAYCLVGFIAQHNSLLEGDEANYHFSQVQHFQETPFVIGKTYSYHAPMTPGHHIFLAWCTNKLTFLTPNTLLIARAINALFTLILLLLLYYYLSSIHNECAFALFLPICLSHYIFFGMIWLGTDNSSLLWVTLAIIILFPRPDIKKLYLASTVITLAILWRQVHFWLVVPLFWRCCELHIYQPKRIHFFIIMSMPIVALFYFFTLWQGMAPPIWRSKQEFSLVVICTILSLLLLSIFIFFTTKISPYLVNLVQQVYKKNKTIFIYFTLIIIFGTLMYGGNKKPQACTMYTISLFGIFSFFYLCSFYKQCFLALTQNIYSVFSILLFSFLFVWFVPLYNIERGGGVLWSLGSRFPYISNSSLIFFFLFPIGSICLYLWYHVLSQKEYTCFVLVLVIWMLAHGMSVNVYHRYYEPFLLILLGIITAISLQKQQQKYHPILLLLPGVLGAGTYMRYFV